MFLCMLSSIGPRGCPNYRALDAAQAGGGFGMCEIRSFSLIDSHSETYAFASFLRFDLFDHRHEIETRI